MPTGFPRSVSARRWQRLVILLLIPFIEARADYTPAELLAKAEAAHTGLDSFSLQIWSRSFGWSNGQEPTGYDTAVVKIVKTAPGIIGMASVSRVSHYNKNTQDMTSQPSSRKSMRVDPGPRYLINDWDPLKKRWSEYTISPQGYVDEFWKRLGWIPRRRHPFDVVLFSAGRGYGRHPEMEFPADATRIVGRENISGHDCIRLETASATVWFDEQTLLVRRVVWQQMSTLTRRTTVVDTYYELRPLAANDSIRQATIADQGFEDEAMQWVPFLPLGQLQENLRITGRAAGLLITPREDQPLAQPALPPLSAEQLAAIVTIEGDAMSGLGFFSRHQSTDFLVTDARLITRNRWLKIRTGDGQKIECIEAHQGEGSNVAVIKTTRVPGRLQPPPPSETGLKTYLLCAFNTKDTAMRPAFCVDRSHPSGRYEVSLSVSDQISGGPIIDTTSGAAAGVLIESDLERPKRAGVLTEGWHAEPLFSHKRWYQIGLVPQR